MTTHGNQSIRFSLFVIGQVLLTIGFFSMLLSYTSFTTSLAMITFGALFLGFGGPSMTLLMRSAFPLRLRISLFLLSISILAAAFAIHTK